MAPQVNATHRCLHEQLLAAEAARGTLVLDVQNVHHVRSDGIGAGTLRSCAPPADLAEDYSPLDPAPELLFETLLLFLVGILLLVGLLTAAAACCIILLLLPSMGKKSFWCAHGWLQHSGYGVDLPVVIFI